MFTLSSPFQHHSAPWRTTVHRGTPYHGANKKNMHVDLGRDSHTAIAPKFTDFREITAIPRGGMRHGAWRALQGTVNVHMTL
jgi:hypothetical protein